MPRVTPKKTNPAATVMTVRALVQDTLASLGTAGPQVVSRKGRWTALYEECLPLLQRLSCPRVVEKLVENKILEPDDAQPCLWAFQRRLRVQQQRQQRDQQPISA